MNYNRPCNVSPPGHKVICLHSMWFPEGPNFIWMPLILRERFPSETLKGHCKPVNHAMFSGTLSIFSSEFSSHFHSIRKSKLLGFLCNTSQSAITVWPEFASIWSKHNSLEASSHLLCCKSLIPSPNIYKLPAKYANKKYPSTCL